MNRKYVLAIDQGTTGTTVILFDSYGQPISSSYREIRQIFPQPGWVEHDPVEILHSCIQLSEETIYKAGIPFSSIQGIGITNQRESVVIWNRYTGKPVYHAICWQCRRTAELCERLKSRGFEKLIREKTGLPVDAYFSATKIRWILDNTPYGQRSATLGDLLCGTVDSWLVWNLTGGKAHVTDFTNASRTMLFNLKTLGWDQDLLDLLDIPPVLLPKIFPSSTIYGETGDGIFENCHLPIASIAGDQQAALFGQACHHPGMAKNTYGTGAFVLINTGDRLVSSRYGLITTPACFSGEKPVYALEGSIFISGAVVQWLRDELGIIKSASESEALAATVKDNGGVYFVPAFVGLGAPYWDMYARGTIIGLTRGSSKGHLARAALEAIAFQVREVIEAMEKDTGLQIPVLRVDGNGSLNNLLMQFQADILGIPVQRTGLTDITAAGAAYLAGLSSGVWQNLDDIARLWQSSAIYKPKMSADERETLFSNWKRAVERARNWAI